MSPETNKTGNPGNSSEILSIIGIISAILAVIVTGLSILSGILTLIKDAESYSNRLTVISDTVTVDTVGKKKHISFLATITNKGNSELKVDGPVRVRLWLIPMTTLTNNCVFDWETYMNTIVADCETSNISYQGIYTTGETVTNSFDFFVDPDKFKNSGITVLARADAKFKTTLFFNLLPDRRDSDYKYDVVIFRNHADSLKLRHSRRSPF